MPATKITELLPIPKGVQKPHPYQVFGLEEGEQDSDTIKQAVKRVVTQLKAVKGDTDSKLWSSAARMAQEAREILADPKKKAQLDARFGIVAIEDSPVESEEPAPRGDPLAGVLPAADPLAAMLPSSNPLAPVASGAASSPPASSPPASSPPASSPAASSPAVDGPQPVLPESAVDMVAAPSTVAVSESTPASIAEQSFAPDASIRVEKPTKRRRRRSVMGTLVFVAFSLGMVTLIGLLSYFLFFSSGQVAITNTDGQFSITTKEAEGETTRVSPPASAGASERRPVDPVMGSLAGNVDPPKRTPSGLTSNSGEATSNPDMTATTDPDMTATAEPDMTDTDMSDTDMSDPTASEGNPSDPPGESVFTTPEPEMTEPDAITEEMIAAAAQKLANVRSLIREAKWKEMKGAAEALSEMPMSEEQAAEAEALYELADLATYYRVGIEREVSELNTGDDFAVTDSFRVIVVEKGDDLLVVRYNERNRSFTFDEFPFSLTHKLGTFSMPDSPTTQAAKAVYQAIAPKATPAHREESIDWLRGIDGEVEGADVDRLIDTIEALFGEDA